MSTQLDIFADSPTGEFVVRPSGRARNLALHVHPGGQVEVVAPLKTRPADIEAFVVANRPWIERARGQLRGQPVIDRSLPDEISLPAIGEQYSIVYGADCGRRRWLQSENTLALPVPRHQNLKGAELLRRWLAQRGREQLMPWLRRTSQQTGIDYRKTQIRGQKTRWGSCSSKGTISLNYCLLFLEPSLVRYLLVHELCHRIHFDHSDRYWLLVASHVPDFRSLDRQLGEAWRVVPGWALPT